MRTPNPSRPARPAALFGAALFLALGLVGCDAADPIGSGATSDAIALSGAEADALEAALLAVAPTVTEAGIAEAAASASADDRTCTGTIGPVSIDGNVIVPDGASCTLNGTRIDGNVIVGTGATLVARGVEVGGNVQAEGASGVLLRDRNGARSTVGGSVQLNQGDRVGVTRTTINGDLQVEQNTGRVEVSQNRIDANVQINQNTGGVRIANNRIAENLQCQANNPPPTGGGNTAGDKEDQCENL